MGPLAALGWRARIPQGSSLNQAIALMSHAG